MQVAPRQNTRWAFLLLAVGLFQPAFAADSPPQPQSARELSAAGSDEMLWIALGEWGQDREEFNTRFWCRQSQSEKTIPPRLPMPQLHRVRQCAVVGQVFDVFFNNGVHYRYSESRGRRVHQLPGKALPLAVAGESQGDGAKIWAVVSPEVAVGVESSWRRYQESLIADKDDDESGKDSPTTQVDASPLPVSSDRTPRIVMYDGRVWQPMGVAIPECTEADAYWLAVADGRRHLFWMKADAGREINHARYEKDQWTIGAKIIASAAVRKAAVAVANKHVVFAALVQDLNEQGLRCERWSRGMSGPLADAWNHPAPVLDAKGASLRLPLGSAVALFGDRLALVQLVKDGPEVGYWIYEAGGKPEKPFTALSMSTSTEGPGSPAGLRDFLTMLVIAGMLMLVFWRRQDSPESMAVLPPGLQVAGPAKRTLAFAIDAAPAAAIVLLVWHGSIGSFYHALSAASASGEPAVEWPSEIVWAWFWFRVIYTVYSTVFEVVWSATPGKRLVGCMVISETIERPGILQIGIRNIARMVELEPYLKIWPFLFVVFFTANRQRMGDLLARTIVVQRQAAVQPAGERHEDKPSEE